MARFLIRNLQYEDIPDLIPLPQSEGREMGLESEIKSWLKVDPLGMFIAESTEDGQIAGCCCGIALSDKHGYIGMYVVKQNHRGLGLGRILWDSAIARLGNRNISLSSAEKMLPFYQEKGGFSITAEWTVDLYSTMNPYFPDRTLTDALLAPFIVVADPEGPLLQLIVDYDTSIHEYNRSAIVKATIAEAGTLTIAAIKRVPSGRYETTGYACMKKSMQGHWLIAPLYAEDYESAYSLLYGLLDSLNDDQRKEGVVAKLISCNCSATKLFALFGMQKSQYQLRRLFTKEVFRIPENKIFALQSSVFCTE